ncbi:ABC transporter permease [Bifidobacterium sp. wkB344]|nr:ABC transporter permease [Bifidobacterium sp. wkB344]
MADGRGLPGTRPRGIQSRAGAGPPFAGASHERGPSGVDHHRPAGHRIGLHDRHGYILKRSRRVTSMGRQVSVMHFNGYLATFRLNFKIELRSIWLQAVIVAIPLIIIPFMLPSYRDSLRAQGHLGANGSEQALPGFAILFSMFSLQLVLQLFFQEHEWHTWDRMRVSAVSLLDLVMAKLSVSFMVQVVQVSLVMLVGTALYHYRPNGSVLALAAVCLVISIVLTLFGLLLYIFSSSQNMAMSFNNILGMLLAGMGGALSPVSGFPDWAQKLAKGSPVYWAMDAVGKINFDHAGMEDVWPDLRILLAFLLALALLATVLFKRGVQRKE